ncbi:MAG: A24 family peptidase [Bryobacteraceae bacterium]
MPDILQIVLASLTAAAAISDLRSRTISNGLVLTGLMLGFALNIYLFGWNGFWRALSGFGLASAVYLPLFALRAMGGGDVKFMAAIGSITGAGNWFVIFLITSILGGIVAILLLLIRRNLSNTLRNVGHILTELAQFRPPHLSAPELSVDHPQAVSLPHGAVIAGGSFLFLVVLRFGLIQQTGY